MSTPKEPKNTKGFLGNLDKTVLGPGFVAFDAYMGIKEGESVPVAVGSALLWNAAFELAPGGWKGGLAIGLGLAAVQMGPALAQALEQKKTAINKYNRNFGGSTYQSSEAQQALLQQGLHQIQNAQLHNTKRMANHARGAQKVY